MSPLNLVHNRSGMRCRVAFLAGFAVLCALAQIGAPARAADPFSLTISMDGTGTGTVECEVGEGPAEACAASYPEGTELALVPSPDPDSEFAGFSGDCGPDVCELTMGEGKSVTATFELAVTQIPLTLKIKGTGNGTVECQVGTGSFGPCKASYPEGTELTVVGEPDSNSEFERFSGDCTEEECDLTMDEPHSVNVFFVLIPPIPQYSLTVYVKGSGSGTVECEAQEGPEPCQATYPDETELAFLQEAAPGSEFAGWSGSGCSGTGECEVTMTANKSVTATFNLKPPGLEYPLTVEHLGTGEGTVTSDPAGIDCGLDCSESYLEGTKVTLTATPAPGSVFDHWTGGGCSGSGTCTTTMSTARTAKAVFTAIGQHTLTVEHLGTGSGTVTSDPTGIDCGSDCTESLNEGTEVTLSAAPAPGSEFAGWSGAGCSGTGACEVTMTASEAVTATFSPIPPKFEYPLTVEHLGTGSGTVTSDPAGIDCGADCSESYLEGTEVTLTATPAPGSAFDHWTGGGCSGSGTCTTTMSTSRTAKAVFTAVGRRTLTVSRTGTGKGTVTSAPAAIDCGQTCEVGFGVGAKVTLTATAAAGSRFAGFSGACTGTGSCRVTMDEARAVSATFEKVPNGWVRAAATAKVRAGRAMLKVSCVGEGPCRGKLKLLARLGSGGKRVTIGTASFSLSPGASQTLRAPLTRKAKQTLSGDGKGLPARAAGAGVRARQVRLKLA